MYFVKLVGVFFYLGFFCLFSEGSVFLLNDVRSGVVKFSVANAYLNEDFEIDIVDVFKGVGLKNISCEEAEYSNDLLLIHTNAGIVIFREDVSVYASFTMISMVWYFDDYCLVLESWSYRNKRKLPPKIRRRLEKAMGYIRILNKLQVSHYSFLESVLFGESYVRNFHEDRIIEHDLVPVIERLSHSNEFGKFEATILYYEFLIDKGVADRQRAFFNLMSCFIEHVKKKKKNEKKELLSFQDLRCMWEFSYGCLVKKYTKDVSLRGEGSVPVFIEQVLHALFNFMINCDFPREYVCRALDGIIYYSSDEAKEQIYQLFDRWWLEYIGS